MFGLMASMITGVPVLDAEHRELVDLINAIADAERSHRPEEALAALGRFRSELESHFRREDTYFGSVRYPDRAAHTAHHAATLVRLEEIIANFAVCTAQAGGAATICFDELLRAVLLQDLQVVSWMADRGLRMT